MKGLYEHSRYHATEIFRSEVDDAQWIVPPECKTLTKRHFGGDGASEDTDSGGEEILCITKLAIGQILDMVPTARTDEFEVVMNKRTQYLCISEINKTDQ